MVKGFGDLVRVCVADNGLHQSWWCCLVDRPSGIRPTRLMTYTNSVGFC